MSLLDKLERFKKSDSQEAEKISEKITEKSSQEDLTEKKTIQDKKDVVPRPKKVDINKISLITALNYAINTIKNKKGVKNRDITSTYYQYYLEWNKLREYFMKQQGLI